LTKLVVGLGNPGPDYAETRHNAGFMVLDHLAAHEGLIFESPGSLEGYDGPRLFLVARSHDPDALLVKPQTFMNRSGEAVAPLARWASADPSRILVVYDDVDLPLGRLRIRPHGGTGGHRGMQSIVHHLDTTGFPRLRLGIGSPRTDAARHVLSMFTERERAEVDVSVAEATDAVLDWLATGDIEGCMTRFHSRWNQGS